MPLERDLALRDEDLGRVRVGLAQPLALLVGLCLGEAKTEDDEKNWWASTEPEELALLVVILYFMLGGRTGRQPWPTVFTKGREKTVAKR